MIDLVGRYGYLAIVVGTFIEGETVVALGGFAAHRGYLSLPLVVLAAFAGTLLGDQLWFFIGRTQGEAFLRKRPVWQRRTQRAQALLERHHVTFILGFRFLYGLRVVSPFAIGMTRVPVARYLALNVVGAAIWSIAIGGGTFLLGEAAEAWLGRLRSYELWLFGAIAAVGALTWGVRLLRLRRERQRLRATAASPSDATDAAHSTRSP